MAKKKSNFDIYSVITDKIIDQLETGNIPWLKPWNNKEGKVSTIGAFPFNGHSGRNYSGINLLLLGCNEYSSNAYYTYKQATELGGNVKKGEKSHMVTYWSIIDKEKDGKIEKMFFLKYYRVFNFEQCENLPEPKHVVGEPIEYTDLDSLIKEGLDVSLSHGGNKAFYSPSADSIQMPVHTSFIDDDNYKATLLHELTHSTGHKDRCDRDLNSGRFGNEAYAFEELVAELGSAFLSPHFEVKPLLQHNASYIKSWLKVLKNDKKAIITASSQATKAAKWVLEATGNKTEVQAA